MAKLHAATGIFATIERASHTAIPGHGVIVGSVQTIRRRLRKYAPDAFDPIICDEPHHCLSDEWRVDDWLDRLFPDAEWLCLAVDHPSTARTRRLEAWQWGPGDQCGLLWCRAP